MSPVSLISSTPQQCHRCLLSHLHPNSVTGVSYLIYTPTVSPVSLISSTPQQCHRCLLSHLHPNSVTGVSYLIYTPTVSPVSLISSTPQQCHRCLLSHLHPNSVTGVSYLIYTPTVSPVSLISSTPQQCHRCLLSHLHPKCHRCLLSHLHPNGVTGVSYLIYTPTVSLVSLISSTPQQSHIVTSLLSHLHPNSEILGFSMWHFLKLVVGGFLLVLWFPPLLHRLTHLAPDRPLSPARPVHCQITDRPRSTTRHMATTTAAIVVVINDILRRPTVTFSAFSALSSRIFCSKIEHVKPEQRIFETVTWLGEQTWTTRDRPSNMSQLRMRPLLLL